MLVGVLEREPRLPEHLARQGDGKRSLLGDEAMEVGPVDELHDEVELAVLLVGVEPHHDVRVVKLGGRLHLAEEPVAGPAVGDPFGGDHLDRDDPIHHRVERLVDLAETAAAQLVENPILPEDELLRLPRHDLLALVGGEHFFSLEPAGELMHRQEKRMATAHLGEPIVRKESVLLDLFEKRERIHQPVPRHSTRLICGIGGRFEPPSIVKLLLPPIEILAARTPPPRTFEEVVPLPLTLTVAAGA